MKFPLPQQGSKVVCISVQYSSGILESISSTNLTGVGISALFFFSSFEGIKCFSIKERKFKGVAIL
jgi:hypothetical protein